MPYLIEIWELRFLNKPVKLMFWLLVDYKQLWEDSDAYPRPWAALALFLSNPYFIVPIFQPF